MENSRLLVFSPCFYIIIAQIYVPLLFSKKRQRRFYFLAGNCVSGEEIMTIFYHSRMVIIVTY